MSSVKANECCRSLHLKSWCKSPEKFLFLNTARPLSLYGDFEGDEPGKTSCNRLPPIIFRRLSSDSLMFWYKSGSCVTLTFPKFTFYVSVLNTPAGRLFSPGRFCYLNSFVKKLFSSCCFLRASRLSIILMMDS